ncbi:glucan phosphoethanolaminetransferase (alkaline phosphatase superfamily) [Aureibacter tunicatorum]|uniref:Glucan phosphoethanolaminetransferase (Alkaline phosphatase superfamily) n=1 Tax=Aureibacter tunicatorum TaxID=866807 RepID=A0AAE3XS80_9BACT|nr:glucan phosphoethanolaminetransferase (alkaline phosphatase superfamily) [Aureibacter tunicatorum]BDD07196.1 hypothetical protein AUTU_46790 [Aureibacter tunicatorum]
MITQAFDYSYYIKIILLVSAVLIGVVSFNSLKNQRPIIGYLIVALSLELISKYISQLGISNWYLLKYQSISELFFLNLYYFKELSKTEKKYFFILFAVYYSIVFILSIFSDSLGILERDSVHIWFVLVSIYVFVSWLLENEKVNKERGDFIIMNIGIFVYFASSYLVFKSLDNYYFFTEEENLIIWLIPAFSTMFLYSCCIRSFIISKRGNE